MFVHFFTYSNQCSISTLDIFNEVYHCVYRSFDISVKPGAGLTLTRLLISGA